jgi:LmbE family N-acetylglucosaminyl deacetylase
MGKSILVVAAHPDDEVLGCGATIAKHAKAGDRVHIVILAEGVTSRDERRDRSLREDDLAGLAGCARRAREILGAASVELHDFPDNRMDCVDLLDIVKVIESHVSRCSPEIVYTHHPGDVNVDHRRVHEAVITACRPFPCQTVKTLLFFEVASCTEWQMPGSAPPFLPNWFVETSDTLPDKMLALAAYGSEMRPWPHARSLEAVEHLARWRGATVGVAAAEAFMAGRNLVA